MLKKLRISLSLLVFIVLGASFIFTAQWLLSLASALQFFQFVPAAFRVIFELSLISLAVFLFLMLLTLFFGRIYCSFLCPLGFLQDVAGFIAGKIKAFRYHIIKPLVWIKYPVLFLVFFTLLFHSLFMLNLLDPYSVFGRICTNLFLPAWTIVQGFFSSLLEQFQIYSLSAWTKIPSDYKVWIYTLIFTVILLILSAVKGRLYCNSLCPVGTILGFISKFSFYQIRFNKTKCNQCGLCEINCKASCMDSKSQTVFTENCINCFNCLQICPQSALDYSTGKLQKPTDFGLRNFLKTGVISAAGIAALSYFPLKLFSTQTKKIPILPPGSVSQERFKKTCTACHKCVSACPTRVIQPGLLANGLAGIFQPALNYSKSFCEYECSQCVKVCPTGALNKITLNEKKQLQLGLVELNKKTCLVYASEQLCGACAEVCPTRAVTVFEYKKNLYAPQTFTEYCIGCGACQYACPVKPEQAIQVAGIPIQTKALPPKEKGKDLLPLKTQDKAEKKDFPF